VPAVRRPGLAPAVPAGATDAGGHGVTLTRAAAVAALRDLLPKLAKLRLHRLVLSHGYVRGDDLDAFFQRLTTVGLRDVVDQVLDELAAQRVADRWAAVIAGGGIKRRRSRRPALRPLALGGQLDLPLCAHDDDVEAVAA
jgi:hypothetical protein